LKTNVAVVLAVALLGCSDVADAPGTSSTASSNSTDSVSPPNLTEPPFDSVSLAGLTCTVLLDSVFLAPSTRATLVDSYGAPDSTVAVTEPNRHVVGAIDSLFVVYYPGLNASFRKPSDGSDLVTQMDVADNRYLRYPSLGIGARSERLLHVLSDPAVVAVDRIEYNCGIGADEPVTFWLSNGQVRRVSKSYYVD